MLQGQKDLVSVGQLILSELAPVVGVQQAEFFVLDSSEHAASLRLMASYASSGHSSHGKRVQLGEGLIGQCAVERRKILLESSASERIRITSGLISVVPHNVLVLPVIFEGQVKGVIELASSECFNPTHLAFLDQLTESIGIVINTIEANTRTEDLLKQSQSLARELQSRQEELQTTNEELQEKARLLAHQNQEVERKNTEVEQARQALEEKAKQLALTSKYKSEFLANMSHELRTPLNSLLILSDQLCKNSEGNLSARQIEFSRTIHSSGNELLMLINDILDLSKIESGTVAMDFAEHRLADLTSYVERTFRHVAEARNVEFVIELGAHLPASIRTDIKRLQQILKNLLSNAFKFTHRGHVTLSVEEVSGGCSADSEGLDEALACIAFSVSDTGIGISADKQQIIFEAFQQADGSTSRKYGGTGLGLAISRELSKLLGGEIRLVSSPNKGSTFTLYLPLSAETARVARKTVAASGDEAPAAVRDGTAISIDQVAAHEFTDNVVSETRELAVTPKDDRFDIMAGDRVLMIVENDLAFAHFLLDVAREQGFKGLVSPLGAPALALANEFKPDVITLDLFLPDMDGWRVLGRLKNDMTTRHIPVCVISTDESRERALRAGAFAFLAKPIQSREILDDALGVLARHAGATPRKLLVALADSPERKQLVALLCSEKITPVLADAREQLLTALIDEDVCAVVMDEDTFDTSIDDMKAALANRSLFAPLPLIVFAPGQADGRWMRETEYFNPGVAPEMSRLLDLCVRALHIDRKDLSEEARRIIETLHGSSASLAGRKALIVDDDMRNIFALATVLEDHGMRHVWADNGRDAIGLVESNSDIDIVLMDIMMPEMDGLVTTSEIRKLPVGRTLPIIAVTAKAMKGDRERCIEAGAWDYLSKPVNRDDLLAALLAWLHG
jgi:signal transduction histidine kinase/CheY-like chemotaxis protein